MICVSMAVCGLAYEFRFGNVQDENITKPTEKVGNGVGTKHNGQLLITSDKLKAHGGCKLEQLK